MVKRIILIELCIVSNNTVPFISPTRYTKTFMFFLKKVFPWPETCEKQSLIHESLDESVPETAINVQVLGHSWKQEIQAPITSFPRAGHASGLVCPVPY